MLGFAMHNTAYRVTVQWRYGVYMKGPKGPFQTSITINVQNLVVTSPDVGRVLRWDPEKGIADTSFSYNIECAQRKQVQVTVKIYDMNRNLVYELTEQKICPGSYSFTWDGTVNTGYYEYPPDEGSNIAPSGLYTFDVEVIANPYDKDAVRSQALTVVPGPVEYFGYDDGGTPEDESDDNYLYYLRWYALYSGRDASYGEIWLYDPDLVRVKTWIVPVLQCVVHEDCDGLTANPSGETHGIIIPVPVSLMEKEGIYRFVLHFYDNYADTYRNHQIKAALEVNATESLKVFHIEDDWMVTSEGVELKVPVNALEVKNAFRRAGWIVHTAGSKCNGKTCVLPSACTKVPYRETLPTPDQPGYSRKYFYYYAKRKEGKYVHVIGAAYETDPRTTLPTDLVWGRSNWIERYSYVFVRLIRETFHGQADYFIKQTLIHELGHQFELAHHPFGEAPYTRNGKFCVMMEGAPSFKKDIEFCEDCLRRIRNYNWK